MTTKAQQEVLLLPGPRRAFQQVCRELGARLHAVDEVDTITRALAQFGYVTLSRRLFNGQNTFCPVGSLNDK